VPGAVIPAAGPEGGAVHIQPAWSRSAPARGLLLDGRKGAMLASVLRGCRHMPAAASWMTGEGERLGPEPYPLPPHPGHSTSLLVVAATAEGTEGGSRVLARACTFRGPAGAGRAPTVRRGPACRVVTDSPLSVLDG
jgi:hypothetical protein